MIKGDDVIHNCEQCGAEVSEENLHSGVDKDGFICGDYCISCLEGLGPYTYPSDPQDTHDG